MTPRSDAYMGMVVDGANPSSARPRVKVGDIAKYL